LAPPAFLIFFDPEAFLTLLVTLFPPAGFALAIYESKYYDSSRRKKKIFDQVINHNSYSIIYLEQIAMIIELY
jgi:hypothetical protein